MTLAGKKKAGRMTGVNVNGRVILPRTK